MADITELERALVNAHNAGDTAAATKLAAAIREARGLSKFGGKNVDKSIEAYTKGRMSEEDAAQFERAMDLGVVALPKGKTREDIQPPGVMARVADVFTGGLRQTEETKTLPEWTTMPELNQLSAASAASGLGTMFASSEEIPKVLQAQFPGIKVRQDQAGNYIMRSSVDGKEYAIPPGFSLGDLPRALGGIAAFTPAGRIASIPGTVAASAGTQAAIEATQAATGGEFNVSDVALAGGAAAIPGAAAAMKQGAKQAIRPAVVKAVEKLDAMRTAKPTAAPAVAPTAGTGGSAGAAGTDVATVRQMAASELPVPINLTEGQATRQFGAQQFEREVVKQEIGAPIRERFAEQNRQLVQNFDAFIDETGAAAVDKRSVGESVDAALKKRIERDKAEIRVAYKEAEKAGEMAGDVELTGVSDYLNKNRSGRSSAPIMKALEDEAFVQEVAEGSLADGTFKLRTMTLKQAEELRKSINRNIDPSKPNDMRVAAELKSLIDDATEGMGGDLYKKARQLRSTYSENFSNNVLIRNIVGLKRGSTDRTIALEDVFQKSMLNSSLDDVKNLHRVLRESGDLGEQAWRDLRGQTLSHIRDQMTKNIARDTQGNPIPSAAGLDRAITQLDSVGKLDYIFGKKGAEQLRLLNDVAKDVLTAPPGAVNTSNTASAILAAIDMMISGASGMPAPVLSGIRLLKNKIQDKKIQRKIDRALNYSATKQQPKKASNF